MIDVFVDASLSRTKWGCAGIIIRAAAPLRFPETQFQFGLKPGLTSNEGEMLAMLMAARVVPQVLTLVEYDERSTIVRIKTDSMACVRALNSMKHLRSQKFIALTKKVRREWDELRDRHRMIAGWSYSHVEREKNPADAVAQQGRQFYGGLFSWPRTSSETSGASSSKGRKQKGRRRS